VSEEEALKRSFKYDLVNEIIDCLLGLSKEKYKELSRQVLIQEFYATLREILKEQDLCTESINYIFEKES